MRPEVTSTATQQQQVIQNSKALRTSWRAMRKVRLEIMIENVQKQNAFNQF